MLLGEFLIKKKLINPKQLEDALTEQRQSREFLGAILLRKKLIKEEDLLKVLSEQFEMPFVNLKSQYIDWNVVMRFPSSVVVDHRCLPYKQDDAGITVAITNPLDALVISEVEKQAKNEKVYLVLTAQGEMDHALKIYKQKMADRIKKLFE